MVLRVGLDYALVHVGWISGIDAVSRSGHEKTRELTVVTNAPKLGTKIGAQLATIILRSLHVSVMLAAPLSTSVLPG